MHPGLLYLCSIDEIICIILYLTYINISVLRLFVSSFTHILVRFLREMLVRGKGRWSTI